jgi:hypothetical protein
MLLCAPIATKSVAYLGQGKDSDYIESGSIRGQGIRSAPVGTLIVSLAVLKASITAYVAVRGAGGESGSRQTEIGEAFHPSTWSSSAY